MNTHDEANILLSDIEKRISQAEERIAITEARAANIEKQLAFAEQWIKVKAENDSPNTMSPIKFQANSK